MVFKMPALMVDDKQQQACPLQQHPENITRPLNNTDQCPWPRKIIVNVSLKNESLELLSWAVTMAAQPGDSVIAIHLVDHSEAGRDSANHRRSFENHHDDARAAVAALLEQCKELCHFRQVSADVRILPIAESREATLLEQAAVLEASMLVLSPSDVAPNSNFMESASPQGCSVLVVEDNRGSTSKSLLGGESKQAVEEPPDESLPENEPQCRCPEQVQPSSFKFGCSKVTLDIPNDYSPRGVLEGPNPESNGASPGSSNSSSSSNSTILTKPLLTPASTPNSDDEDNSEDDGDSQASCLNLFKHMAVAKRHNTFPSAPIRSRRLIPSFSCSSAQSGMRFSNYTSEDPALNLPSMCASDKPPWRCFTYDELSICTDFFHADNLVGKGGYAEVYKGSLPDGQLIAVKKLTKGDTEQQKEGGFLTELGIIGHVSHPNTTSLIGFCVERGLHLVFPLSPNGSLASLLHGTKARPLEWRIRYRVAAGTARGLHYLHKLCPRRIIHRDIKASNILLGPDFEPQISDFGLAKWLPEQWTHHTVTPIEGTFGYLAPEYFMHGIVDEKTDVFAYGVLLLELITGRRPIDSMQRNIVVWARPYLESFNIQELVDPKLGGAYDMNQLRRLVLTATLCVRQSPLWRPCMNQVLKLLTEDALDQEIPDNWSTLVCSSNEIDEEYTSNEYHSDMNRHRALALES